MMTRKIFGIVLAGGEGKRLMPLTEDRAKPAVPFGGQYRLIDFALSNLLNSGLRQIVVLTQYKSPCGGTRARLRRSAGPSPGDRDSGGDEHRPHGQQCQRHHDPESGRAHV